MTLLLHSAYSPTTILYARNHHSDAHRSTITVPPLVHRSFPIPLAFFHSYLKEDREEKKVRPFLIAVALPADLWLGWPNRLLANPDRREATLAAADEADASTCEVDL